MESNGHPACQQVPFLPLPGKTASIQGYFDDKFNNSPCSFHNIFLHLHFHVRARDPVAFPVVASRVYCPELTPRLGGKKQIFLDSDMAVLESLSLDKSRLSEFFFNSISLETRL